MSAAQIDPVKLERKRALQRAGLATAAALVLLIGVLVFEDGREPETTAPTALTAPIASDKAVVSEDQVPPKTGVENEAPAASGAISDATPPGLATSPAVAVPEGLKGATAGSEAAAPVAEKEQAAAQQATEVPVVAAKPAPPLPDGYLIQLGVFGAMTNADALRAQVEARGLPVRVEGRVVVGPFRDKAAADAARDRLRREGLPAGLVVPPRKGSPVVRAEK
ncbi:MAG: SPOR domain-containing protein [Azoarcus sp.]|nr:SPOR domain-containing protein [Azoarcus sp.]